ncbi:MAG TPA: alpha/beta hydrolase [Candidatus Dormibacteraeota bacterium]|nr:alpha/beta hydrolase [Candidatus Dormibacteraeota bacterium]
MISTGASVEFRTSRGRVTGLRYGAATGQLLLAVPGLSQDARSFDTLAQQLASDTRQVVAISPRGRGESEVTPLGTYGWENHAQDLAEIATQLGQETFDLMGWSFGGLVALKAASLFGNRIRRIVLIDVVGRPDATSLGPVVKGLERLGGTFPTRDAYVDLVLSSGVAAGFEDVWRPYLTDDLIPTSNGFTTRTNKEAVIEDAVYGSNQDPYALWPSLTMPVLLVRAGREILPGMGYIVSQEDSKRFPAEVESANVVSVDANHYNAGYHPDSVRTIKDFLSA